MHTKARPPLRRTAGTSCAEFGLYSLASDHPFEAVWRMLTVLRTHDWLWWTNGNDGADGDDDEGTPHCTDSRTAAAATPTKQRVQSLFADDAVRIPAVAVSIKAPPHNNWPSSVCGWRKVEYRCRSKQSEVDTQPGYAVVRWRLKGIPLCLARYLLISWELSGLSWEFFTKNEVW